MPREKTGLYEATDKYGNTVSFMVPIKLMVALNIPIYLIHNTKLRLVKTLTPKEYKSLLAIELEIFSMWSRSLGE